MMNTTIEKEDDRITCTITSLPYHHRDCNGRNYMDTKRVRQLLIESGHNPSKVLVQSIVDNRDNKLKGIWIFDDGDKVKEEIIAIEEEPVTKTSTRRKNSRKRKKVLDKVAKDVIIEE